MYKREIDDGYHFLDNNDNTYKKCPEGTKKVENNECVRESIEFYIIIIIIILIILIIIALFCIICIFCLNTDKERKNDEMIKEAINLSPIIN